MGIMITMATISILTINAGIVIMLTIALIGKINEHHPVRLLVSKPTNSG